MNYDDLKHNCTSIGCNKVFEKVGLNSAHAQLFLHALKMHEIRISFACHKYCIYRVESWSKDMDELDEILKDTNTLR